MAINRREFLQRAGVTGGALAAAAALPACHTVFPLGYKAEAQPARATRRKHAPIDTVVIVMIGEPLVRPLARLARRATRRTSRPGRSRYGKFFTIDANNQQTYVGPNGPQCDPAHDRLGLPHQPVPGL